MACSDSVPNPTQKSQLGSRWLMLLLLCSGLLGSYYCYDNPSATQNAMQSYFAGGGGNATSTDDDGGGAADSFTLYFNNLYSVYSWPNVILPFFGGYLSDLLGTRLMLLVFLGFITLGQAVFALGSTLPGMAAWYVMWTGRTIFGFGGESLSVAQSALIATWFGGKEMAFALGLNLSLARMGSVINDKVSNWLATDYSVPLAFWVGFGVCLLSLLAGMFTFALDQASEDTLRKNQGKSPIKRLSTLQLITCVPLWRRCCAGGEQRQAQDAESLERLVGEHLTEEEGAESPSYEPEEPTEVIELSAARHFPLTFWLLCVSCVCTYACVLCFNNVAEAFFAQKWLATENGQWLPVSKLSDATMKSVNDKATTLLLITYLVAAFLAPLFGGLIDWLGCRAILTAFSSGLITVRLHFLSLRGLAAHASPPC
jgi:MFS family permease